MYVQDMYPKILLFLAQKEMEPLAQGDGYKVTASCKTARNTSWSIASRVW